MTNETTEEILKFEPRDKPTFYNWDFADIQTVMMFFNPLILVAVVIGSEFFQAFSPSLFPTQQSFKDFSILLFASIFGSSILIGAGLMYRKKGMSSGKPIVEMVFNWLNLNSNESGYTLRKSLLVSSTQNLEAKDPLLKSLKDSGLTDQEAKKKSDEILTKLKKLIPEDGVFVRYNIEKTPFLGVKANAKGKYEEQEKVYDSFILYTHKDHVTPSEIWDIANTSTTYAGIESEEEAYLGNVLVVGFFEPTQEYLCVVGLPRIYRFIKKVLEITDSAQVFLEVTRLLRSETKAGGALLKAKRESEAFDELKDVKIDAASTDQSMNVVTGQQRSKLGMWAEDNWFILFVMIIIGLAVALFTLIQIGVIQL